jgi:photosystem I subunit 3
VNKVVVAGKSTRSAVVSRVVCSAEKKEVVSQMGKAAAAAALSLAFGFSSVDAAFADVAGLTPCADSKAFAKRKKQEVKGLNKRLKQYEAGSAPALALQATIEKTEKRFDTYAKQGLLCGTDGLPHLIADPGLALRYGHAGDVLVRLLFVFLLLWCIASSTEGVESIWVGIYIYTVLLLINHLDYCVQLPTIAFIYVAGWIGYSGTKYVQAAKEAAKPVEKEIIIDVPLAWKLLWAGLAWPVAAAAEFKNGTLLEDDSNITVSPR